MAVNNVVLAPSTDPKLFDSFAIGSPKIHCYQRDGGGEDEYEYVMWFSGRDKATYTGVDENGNKNEIDGTGGSFGRATSKNGLHWQRAEGSYEELPGVVLGLNKESWWGFDTAMVELGCVTLPVNTDAVLTESGIFMCYYHGADHNVDETGRKGGKCSIGVAVSQDGMSFGRVEGENPDNSILLPSDDEVSVMYPEVIFDTSTKSFVMFYTAKLSDNTLVIRTATGKDGFKWSKTLKTVARGSRAAVLSQKGGGKFTLFYENDNSIFSMTSEKLVGAYENEKLELSAQEEEDVISIGSPNLVRDFSGRVRMFYSTRFSDGSSKITLAERERDEENDSQTAWKCTDIKQFELEFV